MNMTRRPYGTWSSMLMAYSKTSSQLDPFSAALMMSRLVMVSNVDMLILSWLRSHLEMEQGYSRLEIHGEQSGTPRGGPINLLSGLQVESKRLTIWAMVQCMLAIYVIDKKSIDKKSIAMKACSILILTRL